MNSEETSLKNGFKINLEEDSNTFLSSSKLGLMKKVQWKKVERGCKKIRFLLPPYFFQFFISTNPVVNPDKINNIKES